MLEGMVYVCVYMWACMLMCVNCEFGCMNAEVREEHWCKYRFLPSYFLETECLLSFAIAYTRLVDPRTPGDSPISISPVHEGELELQHPCGKKSCTSAHFLTPCWEGTCSMHHAVSSAVYILFPSWTIHPTALFLLSWDTVPLCSPVSNLKSSCIIFQNAGMASVCHHPNSLATSKQYAMVSAYILLKTFL